MPQLTLDQRENHGLESDSDHDSSHLHIDRRLDLLRDSQIFSLGLTTCIFESTMGLFIFSIFMCTMLAGSAIFSHLRAGSVSKSNILLSILFIVGGCLSIIEAANNI